ncbi:hypothetical protein KIL84_014784 [Mauremys mutica]|uniref:Uncharacterized protein n=1 Tax=Mauremys mutica TaxID=74926 RepID=A0A9D4B7I7_9SAUR|nr:hypothetical protein KIL84_014784 [Mauremys mutica]
MRRDPLKGEISIRFGCGERNDCVCFMQLCQATFVKSEGRGRLPQQCRIRHCSSRCPVDTVSLQSTNKEPHVLKPLRIFFTHVHLGALSQIMEGQASAKALS